MPEHRVRLNVGETGAGLKFAYAKEGWTVAVVGDTPGQPDIKAGDRITAINKQTIAGLDKDAQVALVKPLFKNGAKLTILRHVTVEEALGKCRRELQKRGSPILVTDMAELLLAKWPDFDFKKLKLRNLTHAVRSSKSKGLGVTKGVILLDGMEVPSGKPKRQRPKPKDPWEAKELDRKKASELKHMFRELIEVLRYEHDGRCRLATLGAAFRKRYNNFRADDYGFKNLQDMVEACPGITAQRQEGGKGFTTMVQLQEKEPNSLVRHSSSDSDSDSSSSSLGRRRSKRRKKRPQKRKRKHGSVSRKKKKRRKKDADLESF